MCGYTSIGQHGFYLYMGSGWCFRASGSGRWLVDGYAVINTLVIDAVYITLILISILIFSPGHGSILQACSTSCLHISKYIPFVLQVEFITHNHQNISIIHIPGLMHLALTMQEHSTAAQSPHQHTSKPQSPHKPYTSSSPHQPQTPQQHP